MLFIDGGGGLDKCYVAVREEMKIRYSDRNWCGDQAIENCSRTSVVEAKSSACHQNSERRAVGGFRFGVDWSPVPCDVEGAVELWTRSIGRWVNAPFQAGRTWWEKLVLEAGTQIVFVTDAVELAKQRTNQQHE